VPLHSWIGAEDPSSSQHCQKVFNKDGSPSQGQKICTLNHSMPTIRHQDVKFIHKTKFPANVLLWLAISESVISELLPLLPILQSTKKCTYVYQYFINLSKNTTKTKKSCSGLIWRLHIRKGYVGPIRKELKPIETTGIRKAMKKVPAKARNAHTLGVTFFCK
jgi:hypothetical protein